MSGPLFGSVFGCPRPSPPLPTCPSWLSHSWQSLSLVAGRSLGDCSFPLFIVPSALFSWLGSAAMCEWDKARGNFGRCQWKRLFPLSPDEPRVRLQLRMRLATAGALSHTTFVASAPASHLDVSASIRPYGHFFCTFGCHGPLPQPTPSAATERQARPIPCQPIRSRRLTTHDLAGLPHVNSHRLKSLASQLPGHGSQVSLQNPRPDPARDNWSALASRRHMRRLEPFGEASVARNSPGSR